MSSALYTKGKENILAGNIDFDADDIKVVLVDSADYTLNIATDNDLADVTAGGRVATSGNFTTKSVTDGIFDADDITFSTVSGDASEYLVIYKDSGAESTSYLIVNIDSDATGIPVTPNGGDITVAWDSGASKIFTL